MHSEKPHPWHSQTPDGSRAPGELRESWEHPPVCGRPSNFLLRVTVIKVSMCFPIKDDFDFPAEPVGPARQRHDVLLPSDDPVCDLCFWQDTYFS